MITIADKIEVTADRVISACECAAVAKGLPFANLTFRPKCSDPAYGGAGLYACFFRNRLIYIGKYLGQKNDWRAGNVIHLRWVKHIGTFTMRERNLAFSRRALKQIYQCIKSRPDLPIGLVNGFGNLETERETLSRATGCMSTFSRFLVAADIWAENSDAFGPQLEDFSFVYIRVESAQSAQEIRQMIGKAEQEAVKRLQPPGNTISNRQKMEVADIDCTAALLCEVLNSELPGSIVHDREREDERADEAEDLFHDHISGAHGFARELVQRVERRFDNVDYAWVGTTRVPDLRVRKRKKGRREFVNAATLEWQLLSQRFLLRTLLPEKELRKFGLSCDRVDKTVLTNVSFIALPDNESDLDIIVDAVVRAVEMR